MGFYIYIYESKQGNNGTKCARVYGEDDGEE